MPSTALKAENPATAKESPRRKLSIAQPKTATAGPIARLIPSSPQPIAFAQLRRAPENVRHVRVDEDVTGLRDDIAAHGLLQSMIGYHADASWPEDAGKVMIVGGGRRLQALQQLHKDGVIDDSYTVPVLIRGIEEAVELSLAENLQQRTMSPVDEFLAFKALMDTGHHSPEGLAARFGFSERVVRQRLRLADVVPDVLDALAERRITIDAATAYAATQDRQLQLEVFKVQERKGHDPHRPDNIRYAIKTKGMRTTDPIFTFVTAEIYERDGGGYEDDLFADGADNNTDGRVLDKPFVARAAAERMIDFQAIRLIEDLKRDDDLAPTIVGHVIAANQRIFRWGTSDKITSPKGFVEVDRRYGDHKKIWKTIRNNGIDVQVVVGIGDDGQLTVDPRRVFVPTSQKNAVDPAPAAIRQPELTPEQRAAAARDSEILKLSRRYAVGSFTGTPFDGRAFWPTGYEANAQPRTVNGVKGWGVPLIIFVTEDEVAAQRARAEVDADAAIAARKAEKKRRDDLQALDPAPAVIEVDGLIHYRWPDGGYWDAPHQDEQDEGNDLTGAYNLYGLLRDATVLGRWWSTIDDYLSSPPAGAQA